jgi:predicted nucleotidyltransferase
MRGSLADALIRLEADLRAIRVRWALVGGLAVSARAEPRTTRDIDVAIAIAGDREAEAVTRQLIARGYRIETHLEQEQTKRIATVRLLTPEQTPGILADALFASSGIEREVTAEADVLEVLPGFFAPVAKIGHLLALKVLALRPENPQERPQDAADIRELLRVADREEIQRARDAIDLISRRGFDRGKDLGAEFERQLDQFREQQESGRS